MKEKEIKKYCSGIDCLTCDEVEPCIYRIANKLQEQLNRKEEECEEYKQALDEIRQYRVCEINDEDGEEGDVILGIINEVKEQ